MKRVATVSQKQLGSTPASVAASLRGDLPGDLQGPAPGTPPIARGSIEAAFLEDLRRTHANDAAPWDLLADPGARVVATGQQPGLLGGPLLVLYKAATAVALARRLAVRLGSPVLPVFWNATDDVDFDEIATVGWHDAERGLFHLQMPAEARRAEGFVGDLPAEGDDEALAAVLRRIPEPWARHLEGFLPGQARDHGDWVGRWLRAVFPELLVIDARSPVLRRHAAPLFERYLGDVDAAGRALSEQVARLEAAGHQRVLSPASMRLGLFLTDDGTRQKTEDVDVLRRAVRDRPESVSPNVVLRPLVQDLLLPTIGFVAGPSEIGYLLELRRLRQLLGVPEPALWSRLSGTVVSGSVWDDLQEHGDDGATWLRSPEAAIRQRGANEARDSVDAAEALWEELSERLRQFDTDGMTPEARQRAVKGMASLQGRLVRDIRDAFTRELLQRSPGLRNVPSLFRPQQRPQERVLAGAWLLAQCGKGIGATLVAEASHHLDALERGTEEHAIWALEAATSPAPLANQERS